MRLIPWPFWLQLEDPFVFEVRFLVEVATMQSNLKKLFGGTREVIEVAAQRGPGRPKQRKVSGEVKVEDEDSELLTPVKRMPGRPKKVRVVAEEVVDEALQTTLTGGASQLSGEAIQVTPRKAKPVRSDGALGELAQALGTPLRLPGTARVRTLEGPQAKLRLCEWLEKHHEQVGGTDG